MYYEGKGVPQDFAEAARWFRPLAEQGDEGAQLQLGFMYEDGRGVLQDYVMGHMWFNIAAANGSKMGTGIRDIVAKHMTPEQIAEAQRRAKVCMESNYKDCD